MLRNLPRVARPAAKIRKTTAHLESSKRAPTSRGRKIIHGVGTVAAFVAGVSILGYLDASWQMQELGSLENAKGERITRLLVPYPVVQILENWEDHRCIAHALLQIKYTPISGTNFRYPDDHPAVLSAKRVLKNIFNGFDLEHHALRDWEVVIMQVKGRLRTYICLAVKAKVVEYILTLEVFQIQC